MDILDTQNPINSVEDILSAQDWHFERISDDEISVEISGEHGAYVMQFSWQEKMNALQIAVKTDIQYSTYQFESAAGVISGINSMLWMGHFDISQTNLVPTFRYTTLLRGMNDLTGSDYLADIIEVALCECEKHYGALFAVMQKEEATSQLAFSDVKEDSYNLAYLAAAGNA